MVETRPVLICGAGPVGLICGLMLARKGVPVHVLERGAGLYDDPRAATTHPATLDLLDRIGMVEEMKAAGLVAPTFQFWDGVTGEKVAEFDHALLKGETENPYVIQCEQFKTARIAKSKLDKEPNARIDFGSEVVGVSGSNDKIVVEVVSPNSHSGRTLEGAYLIGADGGRSTVRKAAGIPFEGFTWEERFVVFTTPFDFGRERGYCYRSYFAHPGEWCNCFKVSGYSEEGLWRTVFPAHPGESEEEILGDAGVQARLQRFFPKRGGYEVVHRNLYTVHQRVAQTFRKGRVLLAGDAAHVNNPIGGMGLNGGIQDAISLAEKLAAVYHGEEDDRLLDLYDVQRRRIAVDFVQQQTIQNKKRLESKDPELRKRNLDELRSIASNPERAKAFLMKTSMIEAQRHVQTITGPASHG